MPYLDNMSYSDSLLLFSLLDCYCRLVVGQGHRLGRGRDVCTSRKKEFRGGRLRVSKDRLDSPGVSYSGINEVRCLRVLTP